MSLGAPHEMDAAWIAAGEPVTDLAESDQSTTGGRPAADAAPQRRPFVPREERDRRRREALDSLTVGEWREGRVTSVVPFGAFVDLGGIDGLVHISQFGAGGYVEKAEDVVQAGQTVRVRIVEIDRERGRVGLSMREPNAPRPSRPAPAERPAGGAAPPNRIVAIRQRLLPMLAHRRAVAAHDAAVEAAAVSAAARGSRDTFRNEARPRSKRRDEEARGLAGGARRSGARLLCHLRRRRREEEPAPTTAEELVARFTRSRK